LPPFQPREDNKKARNLQSNTGSGGGATFNLGPIVRAGDTRFIGRARIAPLPEGVDYAQGYVHCPVPSLTIIVMQFVFTTAEADRLDAELRKNYATHPQPRDDRWTSFVTPAFQKAHGVQDLRQAVRMKCSEWFRRYLPGAFSRTKDAPLPSLELISTNDFSGFEDDDRLPTMRNFITVLGLHPTFEAWKLEDLPGVNVGFPRGFEDPETVLTLSLNRNTALGSWNFDGYGTDKDDAMMFQFGSGDSRPCRSLGSICSPPRIRAHLW
jgi:hypothetical protein